MKILLTFTLACFTLIAQKTYTLRGTVEKVDAEAKRISVANEPIPGGMGAMTMTYLVEPADALARLKPGDHITATFTEGNTTLRNVEIQAAAKAGLAQPGMRLEEFERMALANHPALAQTQANVRASTARARQAGLLPNPTVGYYGDEIRGGYTGGGKQGAFISQTIVTGGKLRAARHTAELLTQESETSAAAQHLRILNDVRTAFYQTLAAQRLLDVRQTLAGVATDAAQTARQLANIGQADRPGVLQAELEQQQAEINLRIARQRVQASWRILTAVTGKPELPSSPLEGDLEAIPELAYDDWLANTLRDSPRMKLAQQSATRSEALLSQARKAAIPDLQLTANLSQNYEPLETTHKPTGLNGGVQLGVQLPIFNRNQGAVAAAKDEIESAKQELTRVKLRIARDLAVLFRDYEAARITAQQYKTEMLPRAEQAYKLYEANYKNMAAAYPQALMSHRTWLQLQADYIQALESVWQSAVEIRGFGLMDALTAP